MMRTAIFTGLIILLALPLVIAGDLSATDTGSSWNVTWQDSTGAQFRVRVVESDTSTGTYSFQLDPGAFSYNLTYSNSQHVAENLFWQVRDASSATSDLENFTVMESSTTMFKCRWDYALQASNINASGQLYMTVYNGTKYPYVFLSMDVDIDEPASDPGVKNTDALWEVEANAGYFDDDASAGAGSHSSFSEPGYVQYDATNNGMGQVIGGVGDWSSSGSVTDWTEWSTVGGDQLRYQKFYKADNQNGNAGESFDSIMWYSIYQNGHDAGGAAIHAQFEDGEHLGTTAVVVVNTGSETGWSMSGAYQLAASSRICNWTLDGATGVTYTPAFRVTGLSGNTSAYTLTNNSVPMTLGTDYYAHWNSTNGEMYVWFPETNDAAQTFYLSAGVANTAPTVTTPSDDSTTYGTAVNISWTVTDAEQSTHNYTAYRNGTLFTSGNWVNATAFNVSCDFNPGYWNVTLDAWDGTENVTDLVYINVTNTAPTVSSPANTSAAFGSAGNISWTVTDPEQTTSSYTAYRNGTLLQAGSWTNNTAFNVTVPGTLGAGLYNITIDVTDGGTNSTDTCWFTVDKATPTVYLYLNESRADLTIYGSDACNLTATVTPVGLTVVVEHANGTDISTPAAGSSQENVTGWENSPTSVDYSVRAYTAGNANYSSATETWTLTFAESADPPQTSGSSASSSSSSDDSSLPSDDGFPIPPEGGGDTSPGFKGDIGTAVAIIVLGAAGIVLYVGLSQEKKRPKNRKGGYVRVGRNW